MNLKNHFLIAMPHLNDPLFSRSVIYIFEHSHEGSIGLIINHPNPYLTVQSALIQLDIAPYRQCELLNDPVFIGGPVNEMQAYILHTPIPQQTNQQSVAISSDVMICSSLQMLSSIGAPDQPKHLQIFLGYAGWSPDQLETEIKLNDWLVAPAENSILFETPPIERWLAAGRLLGVDLNRLSQQVGNA